MNGRAFINSYLLAALLILAGSCAVQKQEQTLRFIVMGDWGMQGIDIQRQVAGQMDALAGREGLDMIVTTGDNFYPFGVQNLEDPLWQKNYESVYDLPNLKAVPWYITLGNHDYMGNFKAQIEYSKTNPNWILPANYYSHDFDRNGKLLATMLFMDSNAFVEEYYERPDFYHGIDEQDAGAQADWVEKQISDQRPVWKLGFAHHPLYTSGAHGDIAEMIATFSGMFEQYRLNGFFAGHDHHLEHIKTPGMTQYFITGGGGAQTRRVAPREYSQFSLSSYGFAYVVLDESCMRVRFIDQAGEELYRVDTAPAPGMVCPTE